MFDEIHPLPVTVALLLVLAGLPAGIGLVGTASAQTEECRNRPFAEEGFIKVSNPAGDTVTATEAYGSALHLPVVDLLPDTEVRNGVDAYEIDLGCEVLDSEVGTSRTKVCVDAYDGFEDDNEDVLKLFEPPSSIERRDFEVKFRDSLYEEVDAEDPTDVENCNKFKNIPEDTRYVIIYLPDGMPRGVQVDGLFSANSLDRATTWGPYTAWFCAKIGPSSCN